MWFNAIGPTTSYDGVVITWFRSWYGKAAWSFFTYSPTGRQPYSFPFTSLSFPLCLALFFLLAWLELLWILFLLSLDENILRQFQLHLAANSAVYRINLLALHFSPNDPIGSRQNWRPFWKLSINNRRTAIIIIRFLAYFPEANLSSTSLPSIFWKNSKTFHQQPENIQRLFISTRNYSKTFSPANCLSRKSSTITRIYSKTFWAATSSSNQQQQPAAAINSNQQQQSTATSSSSNQQQQPAAAINSSNQQRQSTATSSSNQQQQLAATTSFRPTSSIYTVYDDFR